MTSAELENLVRIGKLKREPALQAEIDGLIRSGEARLRDAANPDLSVESRFDLRAEIDAEHAWEAKLAASGDALAALADEALLEHRSGRTVPLDPDEY